MKYVSWILLSGLWSAAVCGAALGTGTLWGGAGEDGLRDLARAPDGTLYAVGFQKDSPDGDYDAWLLHWDSEGGLICEARDVLSGSGDDVALAVAVDTSGAVYVVGTTSSEDLPVQGGTPEALVQSALGNDPVTLEPSPSDAFLARLDDQCQVAFLTYFGGSGSDSGRDVAVFDGGSGPRIYLLASSDSPTLGVVTGYQTEPGGEGDMVVARFNGVGERLYTTFLGGSGADWAAALAVDPASGDVAVAGHTASSGLAMDQSGVWDGEREDGECAFNRRDSMAQTHPCYDIVVARFDPTLTSLRFLTYLGGAQDDYPADLHFDAAGDLLLAGSTLSPAAVVATSGEAPESFPLSELPANGAGDSESLDGFVLKLAGDGSSLRWSRLWRGADNEFYSALSLGPGGEIYLAGHAWSEDLPWVSPLQTGVAGGEGWVTALDGSGSVVFDSLIGGVDNDFFYGVVGDGAGRLWLVGGSRSPNPGGSLQNEPQGLGDGWLVSVDLNDPRQADLRLSGRLTADEVAVGTRVSAVFTVTNQGAETVPGTRLLLTLPTGMDVEFPAACRGEAGRWVCVLGDVAGGGQVEVALTLIPRRSGTLRLKASGASMLGERDPGDDRITLSLSVSRVETGGWGMVEVLMIWLAWGLHSRWRDRRPIQCVSPRRA